MWKGHPSSAWQAPSLRAALTVHPRAHRAVCWALVPSRVHPQRGCEVCIFHRATLHCPTGSQTLLRDETAHFSSFFSRWRNCRLWNKPIEERGEIHCEWTIKNSCVWKRQISNVNEVTTGVVQRRHTLGGCLREWQSCGYKWGVLLLPTPLCLLFVLTACMLFRGTAHSALGYDSWVSVQWGLKGSMLFLFFVPPHPVSWPPEEHL